MRSPGLRDAHEWKSGRREREGEASWDTLHLEKYVKSADSLVRYDPSDLALCGLLRFSKYFLYLFFSF